MSIEYKSRGITFHLKLKERKDDKNGCKRCPFQYGGLCGDAPSACTKSAEAYYKIVRVTRREQ